MQQELLEMVLIEWKPRREGRIAPSGQIQGCRNPYLARTAQERGISKVIGKGKRHRCNVNVEDAEGV
jgi:hypothetical protein